MDLGVYMKSRSRLWLLLGLPAFVLILLWLLLAGQHGRVVRELEARQSVAEAIPLLRRAHERAVTALQAFPATMTKESDTTEVLTALLRTTAQEAGVSLLAVSVERREPRDSLQTFAVTCRAHGPMSAHAVFLNTLHEPHRLMQVDSFHLVGGGTQGEVTYHVTSVFIFAAVPHAVGGEAAGDEGPTGVET